MLLAYIDEIGEPGAFCAPDHRQFKTSPAFGYGGFIIDASEARSFGAIFAKERNTLFKAELEKEEHPGRWEKKGSEVFRPDTPDTRPQNLRVFRGLTRDIDRFDGKLFYYADEKPLGTPKQTNLTRDAIFEREADAMRETLNRVARYAQEHNDNILVLMDQINEKSRKARLPVMYQHILGRAAKHEEMRLITEPPMHIDSKLSANIQFTDWVSAIITRAIDYQLIANSRYWWIGKKSDLIGVRGKFTYNSKLHLWNRALDDINHSQLFNPYRTVHPSIHGKLLGSGDNLVRLQKVKAAAERAQHTN